MDEIGDGLSLLAILAFVAFLMWHGDRSRQDRRRHQREAREKLLEQIGSGEAMTSFLQTEEGKKLLNELNEPVKRHEGHGNIRMSVLGLLTASAITMPLALGFLWAAQRVEDNLIIPGAIIGGVSIGCLIAALLHYVLGRSWGLLKSEKENEDPRRRLE